METFSALLALCAGNSPVSGEFPSQRPVTRSFDVFFHLCLNKWLSKQSWGWWFETPSRSFWRHRHESSMDRARAYCRMSVMHYLKQSYLYSVYTYCVTRPECLDEGNRLIHPGRDKMATTLRITFSNPFSSMKVFEFRLKFHRNLFIDSGIGLAPNRWQAITRIIDDPVQ